MISLSLLKNQGHFPTCKIQKIQHWIDRKFHRKSMEKYTYKIYKHHIHISNQPVIWKTPRRLIPKIVGFPPKSSILIGFSIINHPFWGYPYFWKHLHVRSPAGWWQRFAPATWTVSCSLAAAAKPMKRPYVWQGCTRGSRRSSRSTGDRTSDLFLILFTFGPQNHEKWRF